MTYALVGNGGNDIVSAFGTEGARVESKRMSQISRLGTSNNTRFRRFLPWLSGRLQRSCRGESPIGDRFDAWPASARSFARCHTDSTRERTQAGAAAIRSS